MAELFRDPIWQFVGALVAVIAIVVTIWISQRERSSKRLSYFMRSTELLSVNSVLRDSIKILYKDQLVEDVRLYEFGIKNVGNVPILPTDFIRPIEFFLGEDARILSAEIDLTSPPDLGAAIQWANGDQSANAVPNIVIVPLLLNHGDIISLKGLVTGAEDFVVRSRIVGIKEIELDRPRSLWAFGFLLGLLSGLIATTFGGFILSWLYSHVIHLF